MLFVSTGRDGRGRGRERTAVITRPGEWRQVARWSGSVYSCPGELVLCFSFPAAGGTPGWVGQWCFGRSGRSVLPGPRATCGASRRNPGSSGSPGASDRECSGLRPLPRL